MARGKFKTRILKTMERLAHEHGRPPFRAELTAALGSNVNLTNLSKTLRGLEQEGFVRATGSGQYLQLRTLDGRPLYWSVRVGMPGDDLEEAA